MLLHHLLRSELLAAAPMLTGAQGSDHQLLSPAGEEPDPRAAMDAALSKPLPTLVVEWLSCRPTNGIQQL